MENRLNVIIYTDGACSNNGKENAFGGWGAIMKYGTQQKVIRGYQAGATNNQMELRAVIEGIKALKKPCEVKVITDSKYVCEGASSMREVISRGWMNKSGKPVANKDMWLELITAGNAGKHHITFQHIAGHSGHTENELCDSIAKEQIAKHRMEA